MKKQISRFIFNLKAKKYTKRQKKFMNYSDIHNVLLLFESSLNEKNSYINSIAKQLENDGKKVTLCGFLNKKNSGQLVLPDFYIIDRSKISFFSEPKKEFIAPLLDGKFDVVLDLTLTEILPLQYMLIYANAPFKVGRKIDNCDLLNFMIDVKANESTYEIGSSQYVSQISYLLEQIIFYLKSIKSHN